MVDVVLEVRDARIPHSTCHPQVPLWIGSKPRLVVMNRQDMIARADRAAWDKHLTAEAAAAQAAADAKAAAKRKAAAARAAAAADSEQQHAAQVQQQEEEQQQQQAQHEPEDAGPPPLPQQVFWTDGKTGSGVHSLRRAALKLSDHINAKRAKRGLAPRPVRAVVIGFPNIGKSALINRLLGRRVVESAARPGVTRVLRWVRLGGELDLLDAPGIIPAAFNDQAAAQALAICNDIGEASYVDSLIAAAMIIRIKTLPRNRPILAALQRRYRADPLSMSAEDFVLHVAGEVFGGDAEKAGVRLLGDYRNGALGEFALELPGMQH
ncbi:hypothetical protein OEZ86_002181 [Tetradesmus obliquus]|nr:hypothetical protein OEZ86_002181 [Tetradesmus obliquus]